MHRHWTRRVGALLFGLWFVLAGFNSGQADACPMHGMPAGVAATPASGGGHTMPMGTDSDHGSDSGSSHSHHCTCCCSCCSASVLDVPVKRDFVAPADAPAMVPVAASSDALQTRIDFILPFPTAPPAGPLA